MVNKNDIMKLKDVVIVFDGLLEILALVSKVDELNMYHIINL